ncbi:hypothetical protein G4B88_005538 [Cannabis sativa]|uniref:Uncharacterized protein n=1 Tax=Cannabis sativa TaxID=3483 RepID=A0A7J6H840_CANSA|nr:hypothetical protein G4B88_005538 [Cannabis sativa]
MAPATPTSRLFVSSSSAKGDLIKEPSRCSLLLYILCNWAHLYSTTLVGFDHTGRGRVYKRKRFDENVDSVNNKVDILLEALIASVVSCFIKSVHLELE